MANLDDLIGVDNPLYEKRKGVYPKAVDGFSGDSNGRSWRSP